MEITALKVSRTVYPDRPQYNFRKWRRFIQIERWVTRDKVNELEKQERKNRRN
jgi:hypothetical protein